MAIQVAVRLQAHLGSPLRSPKKAGRARAELKVLGSHPLMQLAAETIFFQVTAMAIRVKFLWGPMLGTWASCGRTSVVSGGAKGLRASWQYSVSVGPMMLGAPPS